ncbi:MAG: Histidine-tRNA ligase [Candidatus Kaiserbacteria bacterium GW2011_GWA2_49_19]|uniref:Histidine--tRNA ligase n=1 Tax=Candidatus Kaiserbacteria bacterium GW2011_GWA2_49_19 TaxID=1618669 RepID=A0A0G1VPK6_9BACT|nr:MAG: Histidine-tRNA ligase [Candidatus Kaiserbacteria bacterium GW2011_GWA2_49_19]
MHDILPEDQSYFQKVYRTAESLASFYGFEKIDTPIMEFLELYEKGTGLTTDIVEKQMFSLKTKGGDILALRPEFTPGVMRAFLQHGMTNLPQPVKLYSIGPVFRYESPQAGRFRQFHQVNLEVFGEKSPAIDSQVIQAFYNFLAELKFKNLVVEINSIGASCCRPYFKKILISYLRSRFNSLCLDCKRRARENPLRVLDCKEEKCQPIKAQAPQIIDHLCEECHNHFKEVLEFLDELGLPYRLNPYLVRGLDYYTKTVFEIFVENPALGGSLPVALVGGGRYDNLGKVIGGRDISACGGAAGIERIIEEMKNSGLRISGEVKRNVFLAQVGNLAKKKSLKLFEEFRQAKIPLAESLSKDSLKVQLARADRLQVRYALILGQKEALEKTVILRDMKDGTQATVKLEKAVHEVKKRLKK